MNIPKNEFKTLLDTFKEMLMAKDGGGLQKLQNK